MKQSVFLVAMSKLTPYQKDTINQYILDCLYLNEEDLNAKPKVCPYCLQETRMIKKGFSRTKQRFMCKGCSHVFTFDSHTITMNSKIERSIFQRIVLDTLACVPLLATAAITDVSAHCVFENRHKILCALEELLVRDDVKLQGTIEFDETYELESQKGCRNIQRKARKRGESSKKRGLSHDQVCIVTTTDRNGHELFKAVGFGNPTSESILENFRTQLTPKSIVYADGTNCYNSLANSNNCCLVHLVTHKAYNAVEHLNTVNSIHSMIQGQLSDFRGVATKYMNRYMSLFVYIRKFLEMDDNEQLPIILRTFRNLHFNRTRISLKTHKLVSCYQAV